LLIADWKKNKQQTANSKKQLTIEKSEIRAIARIEQESEK